MTASAAPNVARKGSEDEVTPYSMHVSSRYLELTQKKLSLTRLPREPRLEEDKRWELGTPKDVLEGLLDFWLETYDWRTQEAHFNTSLPQFRTTIKLPIPSLSQSTRTSVDEEAPAPTQSLRVHFVHKRSKHKNAIPLLFCHNWPSSFIEVQKIVDALTDPHTLPGFGAGAQQAFHIVAPSIPGFGFSDAPTVDGFGLRETAEVFDAVMGKLGYEKYVAHGTGWGFQICRALALGHAERCLAVHTVNPTFAEPTLKDSPMAYLKHRIARWTGAKFFDFGYTPSEVQVRPNQGTGQGSTRPLRTLASTLAPLYALRPQTLAFSLCDSPIGLLAGTLDIIHARGPATSSSPVASRSRSPFLSPVELEMEEAQSALSENQTRSGASDTQPEGTFSPHSSDQSAQPYTWSPTEVLNWTMLQWLPGPEGSLRWLRRATLDAAPTSPFTRTYATIPLGISTFQARSASRGHSSSSSHSATSTLAPPATPVMWGSASWPIAWVKRHQRPAPLSAAWEAPDQLVLDMRECFGTLLSHSSLAALNLPVQES